MERAGHGCVTSLIPRDTESPIDGKTGAFTMTWRRWLEAVSNAINAATGNITAIATKLGSPDGTVANIPSEASQSLEMYGRNGVRVEGKLGVSPVYVELRPIDDDGTGELLALTRDDYGRITGTRAVVAGDLPESGSYPPTLLDDADTFSVPANKQVLFSIPIDLGLGTLDVSGDFVEVA